MDNISSLKIAVNSDEVKNATNNLNNLTGVSGKAEKTVNTLRNAFATIGAGALAKQFIDTSDSLKLLDARLKLATDSTKEFKSQQEQLLKISLQSYTAYSDTVTLFTKLNPALKQVGASAEQVNSVVSSFVKGLQLGGSSASEASSAILQFSQAMGSGVLRGEEFNAIAEASPKLMSYLAKGMGVAQTELRKMAENGELTASRVSNALLKVRDTIDKDFATIPVTVGKAMTNLATATSLMVQDVDNATGATQSLSNMIQEFTGNIDGYSKDIVKFFGDITLYAKENEKTLTQVEALVVGVASAYLAFVAGGAVVAGIGAITNAIVALRVSMLSLQASVPVLGWISAAVGVGAATYIANMDDITEATFRNIKSVEDAQKALDDLAIKRKAISDDKFMLDSEQKAKTEAIDKQTEAIQLQVMALREMKFERSNIDNSIIPKGDNSFLDKFKVNTNKDPLKELETKRNEVEVIKLLGSEYQKFNLTLDERTKKAKELGATEKEINDFRNKEIKDFNDKQSESSKRLSDEQQKKIDDLNKVKAEIDKVGLSDYSLAVQDITQKTQVWIKAGADYNEVIAKQKQLLEELNLQNSLSIASEQLSFLEKKAQLMTDEYEKSKLLLEIKYAQNLVDIQGRNIPIEDKQRLIEQETELYNLTKERIELDRNTEYQETMKTFYDDMLESQINLNEAVYNFGSGFDDVGSKISKVSKSLAAMTQLELTNKKEVNKLDKKYEKEFTKYAGDVVKTKELEQQYTKDTALLNEANVINQINGYANIAGAMSGMFQEGSKEAAAFRMVESGLAIASGVRAILTQGSGDPFTAFARMAAMAASVSSLLSSAGIAFGMNKTTTSSDAFSSQSANEGKGSVLGDTKKASESITNALNTLEDFAQPQYDTLLSMNEYLANISNNIGGVAKILVQNSGFALGEGFTGFDSGNKNNVNLGAILNPINSIISKIPVIGQINSIFGGALNSLAGGLLGKTSVSTSLKDSGVNFADQLLTSAIKEFDGQMYQTVSTTTKKKSWFGSSSSTSISSIFQDLNNETERQFSLVLDGLYQTVLTAGLALDKGKEETAKSLEGFRVALGKISLKDKSGAEIQELLSNAFSKVGDEIARASFPLLQDFQKVGEGLFETLTRVATGMEEAEFYIDKLGNKFTDVTYTAIGNKSGNVGFEALLQSITKFDEKAYGLDNNLIKVVESVKSTASELYTLYTTLSDLRDIASYLSFDIDVISQDSIKGAGSISDLSQGMKDYVDNFLTDDQKLGLEITQMRKEFSDLGLVMPKTKKAFTDMLKTASENNEELYGRLIVLSEGLGSIFDEVESKMNDKISLINDTLNNLDSTISGLRSSVNGIDTYALDKFYQSMAKTQDLLSSGDYESIAKSINETIGLSSALNQASNFSLTKDMQYAQLVAAKQFEDMKDTLKDDVDYLSSIDTNTANTNTSINNLSEVMKAFLTGSAMPSFAVGTSYVSNDMTARIHQGEIITPKNFSDGLRNGDLVMGQTSGIINAISIMNNNFTQNVSNLENKLNSIISISNEQLNQLIDIGAISNESLVTLGNIEVII